jgi:hypothetical protein
MAAISMAPMPSARENRARGSSASGSWSRPSTSACARECVADQRGRAESGAGRDVQLEEPRCQRARENAGCKAAPRFVAAEQTFAVRELETEIERRG